MEEMTSYNKQLNKHTLSDQEHITWLDCVIEDHLILNVISMRLK